MEADPSKRDVVPGLGAAVRARRTALGFHLLDLAEVTGISFANISKIERGTRALTIPTARKLAAAFDCTIDDLLREADALAASPPQ